MNDKVIMEIVMKHKIYIFLMRISTDRKILNIQKRGYIGIIMRSTI